MSRFCSRSRMLWRLWYSRLPTRSLARIAKELPAESWREITWREGTKGLLRSRFTPLKVWMADGLVQGRTLRVAGEELLIEWPKHNP